MSEFGDKILPGQKLPARNVNAMNEALRNRQAQPRQNENQPRDYDQIKVESGFSRQVDIFETVAFDTASWPDRTDEIFEQEGRRNGVELVGGNPYSKWDQVGVLQHAMPYRESPYQSFAQAVTSGPTACYILFDSEEALDFPFAVPVSGSKNIFKASPYGLNRILWHAEPDNEIEPCVPVVLQAYINMGEDSQWAWFKLQADLPCCGSAQGKVVDQCGNDVTDCPIYETIYAPRGFNLCGCENACGTWKKDDVVPAWWFQYLEKWVTIPNFTANMEEKEMEVVTGLQITGGTVTPATNYATVVTNIKFNENYVKPCMDTPSVVYCMSGEIEFEEGTKAQGNVTLTGALGSQQNPIKLDVLSDCQTVTISSASLTTSGDVSLTGQLSGSATVSVPMSNVSLPVTGTCAGTATGTVYVVGTASLDGSCKITNLPTLIVNGGVEISGSATLSGNVSVAEGAITLSGGTQKTFLTNATSFTKPSLSTKTFNLSIPPTSGTITGTLSDATTTPVQFSNLTVTLDLSDIFETELVVKDNSFTFSGCTLDWDTVEAVVLKSGKSLSSISASLSGTINIPSSVTSSFNFTNSATSVTIKGVDTWTQGELTKATDTVTVPTTATLDGSKLTVSGTGTISTTGTVIGTATWPVTELTGTSHVGGTISAEGVSTLIVEGTISGTASGSSQTTATGTATITDSVTVSGPLDIRSGVILRGILGRDCPEYVYLDGIPVSVTGNAELGLVGGIEDNRECYVDVPSEICWGDKDHDWVEVEVGRVPLPGVDLTGATITGITDTIKYLACKECPEEEEEENAS